ncbi:Tripartite tricarboxylate transporter TctB family protein [Tranquillimonas rosea]|uniref:Tripartite tricarboxylate transporter TctB family protein n=1 Tax=Tranquillimonas rosea TaxID=641238 RepID=A0A1H9VDF0_9RHOB|nr:tripartite tricarboxylate transporter TctB family protein [Tranquillimonas rosea]SES19786.1 Tripartite tricarboxylate transporter TctB family protein [Tranquillimonas rosea]
MSKLFGLGGQAIFALVLLVLTTVYASQLPELGLPFSDGREPGASFLPIILSVIMYVALLRILIGELTGKTPRDEASGFQDVGWVGIVGPVVLIVATMLFAAGLRVVGYFAAAGLYTFLVSAWFNYEQTGRPLRALGLAAATAIAITVFGWLFFVRIFGLSLPTWIF